MLKIEGKTFMNIQEAVQWLLDNNALPFQCTANYAGNTEIGMGTIVNPSPAKVRIGSMIFFADSKVSTVVGITENGFICSDQYNNLVDDVAYVTNVAINASGHLITTLSDGQTIDAGIVKQVSGFSINASQHLVVSYNDGSSTDLGAIFNGNVTIGGNLNATGTISAPSITGDSIIENNTGYIYNKQESSNYDYEYVYVGAVKNGNKLTLVVAINLTKRTGALDYSVDFGGLYIPTSVYNKLFPTNVGLYPFLDVRVLNAFSSHTSGVDIKGYIEKTGGYAKFRLSDTSNMAVDTKYYIRYEATFLLSENLAS